MPKAKTKNILPKAKRKPAKPTAAKVILTAAHEFLPMPASAAGWRQCERITRIAFAVLESDAPRLSDPTLLQYADSFFDVAIALKKMAALCGAAHARIVAASIRAAQKGVTTKPATKPRRNSNSTARRAA
jgi:hypothetical protein